MTLTESSDFLPILNELHLDTFPNSRIGLLGFNANLFQHNALGVRGTTERRGLVSRSKQTLLVVQIGPAVFTTVVGQLSSGIQSTRLSFTHVGFKAALVKRMRILVRLLAFLHFLHELKSIRMGRGWFIRTGLPGVVEWEVTGRWMRRCTGEGIKKSFWWDSGASPDEGKNFFCVVTCRDSP